MKKLDICIIGARSFSSGILIKLLLQHKHANISMLISESKGEDIQKIHPFLHGLFEGKTEEYGAKKVIENNDVVFLHKSHGEFFKKTAELIDLSSRLKKDVRFIDLSADFRLKEKDLYRKWYKFEHTNPELLQTAVYGLTELYREKIRDAVLVANPGCYPTATLLALAPLLKTDFVDTNQTIIVDALSGVSGAGKNANGMNMAIDVEQNIKPYKVGHEHQHIPEMEQEISNILKKKIDVIFAPSVLSFKYGILSTNFVKLKESYKLEDIESIYNRMYGSEPFIRILGKYPEVSNVEGTNFCDIGISIDTTTKMCIVMSAIDNVVKGASGQAIQNMNVMYGFEETEGLPYGDVLRAKKAYCHTKEYKRIQLNQELIQ